MSKDLSGKSVHMSFEEPTRPPPEDFILAYGAIVPIVVGAAALYMLPDLQDWVLPLTLLWSAAIVLFLSGVRRGVSFRTPGGARWSQLGMMMGLFLLGFGSVLAVGLDWLLAANILLLVAYIALAVLDPLAARTQDVPNYFASLRPVQMGLAILALVAIGLKTTGLV